MSDVSDLVDLLFHKRIGPFHLDQSHEEIRALTRELDPDNRCWNESWASGERLNGGRFEYGELELGLEGPDFQSLSVYYIKFQPGIDLDDDAYDLYRTKHASGGLKLGQSIPEVRSILAGIGTSKFREDWIGTEKETYWLAAADCVTVFFSLDEETGSHVFIQIEVSPRRAIGTSSSEVG